MNTTRHAGSVVASRAMGRKDILRDIFNYHMGRALAVDAAYDSILTSENEYPHGMLATMIRNRDKHLAWCVAIKSCLEE